MSNNPYAQVALSYLRRPFSSLHGGVMAVASIVMLVAPFLGALDRDGIHEEFRFYHLMPYWIVFGYLAEHAKGQFADSRAHLTPGFRRVHATVAGIATLIFAMILPATLAWCLGWDLISLVALVMLLFGTILWMTLAVAAWPTLVMLAGWWTLFVSELGQAYVRELISGHSEALAVALLGLGILIILRAGIQLVRLNEDMPGYYCWTTTGWAGTNQLNRQVWQAWAGKRATRPGWRGRSEEKRMARLIAHARGAPISRWARVCRWQVTMGPNLSAGVSAFVAIFIVQFSTWAAHKPSLIGAISVIFPVMVPAIVSIGRARMRVPMLAHELLKPVERGPYLRQLGLAMLLTQLQFWAATSIGFAVSGLLPIWEPLSLVLLADGLVISAALQAYTFGAAIWSARPGRQSLASVGPLWGLIVFAMCTQMLIACHRTPPVSAAVLTGAFLLAVGILLTWAGYRRWLVTDFD